MPLHVSSTCAHRQEVKIVLYSLWYHHTYRWPSRAQVERGLESSVNLFRAHVLIVRRSKLYYTASGIITPIGGLPVHRLREDLSPLSTCFEHMCSSSGGQNCTQVLSQPVYRTVTYRCNDTRGCIIQFWPPDVKHMCLKHVEAWNKLIIKFSASSWLILR